MKNLKNWLSLLMGIGSMAILAGIGLAAYHFMGSRGTVAMVQFFIGPGLFYGLAVGSERREIHMIKLLLALQGLIWVAGFLFIIIWYKFVPLSLWLVPALSFILGTTALVVWMKNLSEKSKISER